MDVLTGNKLPVSLTPLFLSLCCDIPHAFLSFHASSQHNLCPALKLLVGWNNFGGGTDKRQCICSNHMVSLCFGDSIHAKCLTTIHFCYDFWRHVIYCLDFFCILHVYLIHLLNAHSCFLLFSLSTFYIPSILLSNFPLYYLYVNSWQVLD